MPQRQKAPLINSKKVIMIKRTGTKFSKIDLLKCSDSHKRFSLYAKTLSSPDCKKQIAKKEAINI